MKTLWIAVAMAGLLVPGGSAGSAQTEMLAATPPMGWSTWNHFHHDISDALVRAQADALVSSGMRDAGYVYVNIDGGWEGSRDAAGVLHPTSNFPDMKALGDYIHSKGLKFGLYTGPGPKTCAGAMASYGFEAQDARMFASWGVDFLKYDLCSFSNIMKRESGGDQEKSDALMKAAYEKMHKNLLLTGRPIVFSMCQYGWGEVWEWGAQTGGNLWRTSGDISDSYDRMTSIGFREAGLSAYAGPGHWNDPDMLEIGNGHMSDDEYRTHMSLWVLVASPLLAGNDIRTMTPAIKSILLNKEVIAIDQDSLGKQASPIKNGDLETWIKPLANGSVAVGVINLGSAAAQATVNASDLQLGGPVKKARDLWAHEDVKFAGGVYTATVPSHGVLLLRVTAK